jgi:hypothetical protein
MEVVCMEKFVFEKTINATPHEVKIRPTENQEVVLPSSGQTLRLSENDRNVGTVSIQGLEVPLVVRSWSLPTELQLSQDQEKATAVIVSLPLLMTLDSVAERLPDGMLFLAPDTGKGAIRNANGQIEATKQLVTTETLLRKFVGEEKGKEETWRVSFFPVTGDEVSMYPVTIETSKGSAAKVAALLHFAGLTVLVEGDQSYANFSSSKHRPLSEFISEYEHWWERE